MKKLLKEMLVELKEIKKLLQVITSNQERSVEIKIDERKLAKVIHQPDLSGISKNDPSKMPPL